MSTMGRCVCLKEMFSLKYGRIEDKGPIAVLEKRSRNGGERTGSTKAAMGHLCSCYLSCAMVVNYVLANMSPHFWLRQVN